MADLGVCFEKAEGKLIDRNVLIFVGRLGAAICLGVGLAGFVLVPAFTIMATGRGSIDWNSLSLSYSGSRIHFIQGFQAGAISGNKKVTLFVGSYALVGALIFYLDSNFGKTRRIWILYWLPFSLLVFYWAPFYFLFSLLKSATSYWYRYSFIFSIPMIFVQLLIFRCRNLISEMIKEILLYCLFILQLRFC